MTRSHKEKLITIVAVGTSVSIPNLGLTSTPAAHERILDVELAIFHIKRLERIEATCRERREQITRELDAMRKAPTP